MCAHREESDPDACRATARAARRVVPQAAATTLIDVDGGLRKVW